MAPRLRAPRGARRGKVLYRGSRDFSVEFLWTFLREMMLATIVPDFPNGKCPQICVQVIQHHRNRGMPQRRGRRLAGAPKSV